MSTSNNRILKLYRSRITIIEQLESLNYDVSNYDDFSINEIDAMEQNKQLDILVNHKQTNRKLYVRYYLKNSQYLKKDIYEYIDELYEIKNTLSNEDTFVIITDDEPNAIIQTTIRYLFDHSKKYIVLHNINRLQFNILNHSLVPKANVLNDEQVKELKQKYSIETQKQLPEISRFDPHALAIYLRPGEICEFKRNSATAMNYNYYRVCV